MSTTRSDSRPASMPHCGATHPIPPARRNSGLVLWETLLACTVILLLLAILIPAAGQSRRLASIGESTNNLRWQGQCHAQYCADSQDKFATFNWTKGNCPSSYPDLKFAADDITAAANQAVDILRRLWSPTFPKISTWFPHAYHSWLVLADYQQMRIPSRLFASPEDLKLLQWQTNPNNWNAMGAPHVRAPFWSSYLGPSTSFFDQSPVGSRISASAYNSFSIPGGAILRPRAQSEVAFPSQKALIWDKYQRHFGSRLAYYLYPEARVPILFVDGAVAVRTTSDSNRGWNPNTPNSTTPNYIDYNAHNTYEPPPLYANDDYLITRFDWTRGFLAGRDFDAPAIP